jgi:hypothetical protein
MPPNKKLKNLIVGIQVLVWLTLRPITTTLAIPPFLQIVASSMNTHFVMHCPSICNLISLFSLPVLTPICLSMKLFDPYGTNIYVWLFFFNL